MKNLFLTVSLLLLHICSNAQTCGANGITFYTQAHVNNFTANYPGCTQILGDASIQGGDITNLNGLSGVTSIGGNLSIHSYNPNFTNLSGLNSLTSVGNNLQVSYTSGLASLTGLNSLVSIGGSLSVSGNNPSLANLQGLNALTTIGGDVYLGNNTSLTTLGGLNSLISVGNDFRIEGNNSLTNISSLNHPMTVSGDLKIQNNAQLSNCSIESICSYLQTPSGYVDCQNNASGCNYPHIYTNCNLTPPTCPPSLYLTFTSQAQIDSFLIYSPNCTSISNNLYISGNNISNLNGLSNIDSIGGDLLIENTTILPNLTGLTSLQYIDDNFVLSNNLLSSFVGIANLNNIKGQLFLDGNPNIVNLSGLVSLDTVGNGVFLAANNGITSTFGLQQLTHVGFLGFEDNPNLVAIEGLDALNSIEEGVFIARNNSLTSLEGLDHPISISGNLYIADNPMLSECAVQSICTYLGSPLGSIDIHDNNTSCNSAAEVSTICNAGCYPVQATITGNTCFSAATTKLTANPGSGHTFLWNTLQTTRSITVTPGTYCVTVANTATGCTGTACVTVCKKPVAAISPVTATTICNGECIPLKAKAGNTATYKWSNNGPTTATWSVCPTAPTTVYTVTVTNNAGCTASKSVTIKTVTCNNSSGCNAPWNLASPVVEDDFSEDDSEAIPIENEMREEETGNYYGSNGLVRTFPNPASQELFVDYAEQLAEIQSLALWDMNGRKMLDIAISDIGYSQVDVSGLSSGLYFLKINGTMTVPVALVR